MAACALLVLLVHLLFAQVTLLLAVAFVAVSKVTRWRSWWLAVPVAVGLAWTLAIGPRAAAAGFAAGPAQVLGYLRGGHPLGRLLQPDGMFAGATTWLPRQLPLALVVAAAEAGLAGWLYWVHTDEWAVPARRPGVLAAVRSALNGRAIRAGALLTRDGCALGVAPATGARVLLRWPEVAGGVLVTGAAAEVIRVTSFQVVYAALRRRRPVITVDMTGDAAVARAFTAGCAATGTPLRVFGTADGCYEPFRSAGAWAGSGSGPGHERAPGPGRLLDMTLALLGFGDPDESSARAVRGYLHVVCELIAAVPADPRIPVLDDIAHLLNPLAMQARFQLVPVASPGRAELADLVRASVRTAQADPQPLLAAARHLATVRRSPAGRWLCPGVNGAAGGIDLARTVRERSAVLFRVDAPDIARLVCADITALCADLRRIGADGDGLVWLLLGSGPFAAQSLAGLVAGGASAGLPVLITTTSPAATDLAALANVLLVHRLADAVTAASLAARTGTRMEPAGTAMASAGGTASAGATAGARAGVAELVARPAVSAQALLSLSPARFVLAVQAPAYRLGQLGQAVPARLPRRGRR